MNYKEFLVLCPGKYGIVCVCVSTRTHAIFWWEEYSTICVK